MVMWGRPIAPPRSNLHSSEYSPAAHTCNTLHFSFFKPSPLFTLIHESWKMWNIKRDTITITTATSTRITFYANPIDTFTHLSSFNSHSKTTTFYHKAILQRVYSLMRKHLQYSPFNNFNPPLHIMLNTYNIHPYAPQ